MREVRPRAGHFFFVFANLYMFLKNAMVTRFAIGHMGSLATRLLRPRDSPGTNRSGFGGSLTLLAIASPRWLGFAV